MSPSYLFIVDFVKMRSQSLRIFRVQSQLVTNAMNSVNDPRGPLISSKIFDANVELSVAGSWGYLPPNT